MEEYKDFIKKAASFGIGAMYHTKEKVEEFVNDLVDNGDVTQDEGLKIFQELVDKGEKHKKSFEELIVQTISSVMDKSSLSQKEDIKRVEEKLNEINRKLDLLINKNEKS